MIRCDGSKPASFVALLLTCRPTYLALDSFFIGLFLFLFIFVCIDSLDGEIKISIGFMFIASCRIIPFAEPSAQFDANDQHSC